LSPENEVIMMVGDRKLLEKTLVRKGWPAPTWLGGD